MPFLDLLTSADLVVGKPAMGSPRSGDSAGAAAPGALRDGWPEVPAHIRLAAAITACAPRSRALEGLSLDDVWQPWRACGRTAPQSPVFGGELEGRNYLERWLATS
jgi:hypothetical protein